MKKEQRDITYDAELLNGLKDPVEAAAFKEAVMDLNDPDALKLVMRKVAQAHGMAEISRWVIKISPFRDHDACVSAASDSV